MKFLIILSIALISEAALQEFINANNLFTTSLYKQVVRKNEPNLLISPYSIEAVLAFAQSGCKGRTAQEIRNALYLPDNKHNLEDAVKKSHSFLKGNDRYTLSIANKIYVQKDFTIKRDFARAATEVFDADVENIDFIQKRRAAGRMNAWVENQTNNKIKNLISPDILDEYTKTILINAIYFQGNWSNKFLNRLTEKKNFYKTNQDVVQVDTMHQYRQWFNYYQSPHLNAKFLEMPFVGRDVSMVFVLPNERGGLATLENQIENVFAPQPLRRSFLNIQLPKFKIETTLSLVNVLKNLGINKAFDEYEADLSGIAGRKGDLHISDVLQKTYVDIEEGGVEAAGATYVRVSPLLSLDFDPEESEPEEFVADHPFLFYIKAKTFIIFAGKVSAPNH